MDIYEELVFMFESTLGIQVSNLHFSKFGGTTSLLRVYEKDVRNAVLTINLDRMRVTNNSRMSMRLDGVVEQTIKEFMETDYFIQIRVNH